MVVECCFFKKKNHLLVCYVCNLHDEMINYKGKTQIGARMNVSAKEKEERNFPIAKTS